MNIPNKNKKRLAKKDAPETRGLAKTRKLQITTQTIKIKTDFVRGSFHEKQFKQAIPEFEDKNIMR
jgi:hypothetical protein